MRRASDPFHALPRRAHPVRGLVPRRVVAEDVERRRGGRPRDASRRSEFHDAVLQKVRPQHADEPAERGWIRTNRRRRRPQRRGERLLHVHRRGDVDASRRDGRAPPHRPAERRRGDSDHGQLAKRGHAEAVRDGRLDREPGARRVQDEPARRRSTVQTRRHEHVTSLTPRRGNGRRCLAGDRRSRVETVRRNRPSVVIRRVPLVRLREYFRRRRPRGSLRAVHARVPSRMRLVRHSRHEQPHIRPAPLPEHPRLHTLGCGQLAPVRHPAVYVAMQPHSGTDRASSTGHGDERTVTRRNRWRRARSLHLTDARSRDGVPKLVPKITPFAATLTPVFAPPPPARPARLFRLCERSRHREFGYHRVLLHQCPQRHPRPADQLEQESTPRGSAVKPLPAAYPRYEQRSVRSVERRRSTRPGPELGFPRDVRLGVVSRLEQHGRDGTFGRLAGVERDFIAESHAFGRRVERQRPRRR